MKKKIIIAYLFTKFDIKQNLINFINNFKKFPPGYPHKLLICYKLLRKEEIEESKKFLKKIKYQEFIDNYNLNDFDFCSYKRISKKYKKNLIFFSLGHSYPVIKNWLNKIMYNYTSNSIIGTSASNESLYTSFLKKKK